MENLTPEEKERRRQYSLIVEHLCRFNGRASSRNYGLAGKLVREYGFERVMQTCERMQDGTPVAYLCGALRRQAEQTTDFALLNSVCEEWK